MDPTACLYAMIGAMDPTDPYATETAKGYARDLLDWLALGGFPPEGYTWEDARGMAIACLTGR
jgi:hypothetical protein